MSVRMRLIVNGENVSESQFHEMDRKTIKSLTIEINNTIEVLSLPRVKQLRIYNCKNLKTIRAPQLESLIIDKTPRLVTIKTPKVKYLDLTRCPMVADLDLSIVERLFLSDCTAISRVIAPHAKKLRIIGCSNIHGSIRGIGKDEREFYPALMEGGPVVVTSTFRYTPEQAQRAYLNGSPEHIAVERIIAYLELHEDEFSLK